MAEYLINKLQHMTEENLLDIEQAKTEGRKVIGFYCLYSPTEIAVAADAIPLGLCGTRNDPIAAAEEVLPRNLCPLIKSSYGFAATDSCPFFRFSDIIVGDTTCDGKNSGDVTPRQNAGQKQKRILITGVPIGIGSDKVVKIVEQCGADVVAFENCSGYKQAFQVAEDKDPLDALAEQYLSTPCSVMSPNAGRFALLDQMIKDFSVDGVIDLTWQACHTYNIEAFSVEAYIRKNFGLPTLHLETDYAESDTEQLRVRIEAYLEML